MPPNLRPYLILPMDKLAPEHLHLLFDEPIYVLEDHGDHPIPEKTSAPKVEIEEISFEGENEKGLAIYIEDSELPEDDRVFLFKGLNALDLDSKDIALIIGHSFIENNQNPPHSLRIEFSEAPKSAELYAAQNVQEVTVLPCNSLKEIQANKDLKVKFWLGLKALLGRV